MTNPSSNLRIMCVDIFRVAKTFLKKNFLSNVMYWDGLLTNRIKYEALSNRAHYPAQFKPNKGSSHLTRPITSEPNRTSNRLEKSPQLILLLHAPTTLGFSLSLKSKRYKNQNPNPFLLLFPPCPNFFAGEAPPPSPFPLNLPPNAFSPPLWSSLSLPRSLGLQKDQEVLSCAIGANDLVLNCAIFRGWGSF